MLAEQDKIMEKTANLIVRYADEDEMNRMRIQAREDLINRERAEQRQKERLKRELRESRTALADANAALADKDAELAETKITAIRNMFRLGITEEQILSCGYTEEEIALAKKN